MLCPKRHAQDVFSPSVAADVGPFLKHVGSFRYSIFGNSIDYVLHGCLCPVVVYHAWIDSQGELLLRRWHDADIWLLVPVSRVSSFLVRHHGNFVLSNLFKSTSCERSQVSVRVTLRVNVVPGAAEAEEWVVGIGSNVVATTVLFVD